MKDEIRRKKNPGKITQMNEQIKEIIELIPAKRHRGNSAVAFETVLFEKYIDTCNKT